MKTYFPYILLVSSLAFSAPVLAQPSEEKGSAGADAVSPDAQTARSLVTQYLEAVKAKKWNDARKLLHPQTVKVIAERKKRLGREDHPLAPWTYEKSEYYLKAYKLGDVEEGPNGTFIVHTQEDNYQVEEKGISEADPAAYLVGRKDGKWYVTDKKRGETFGTASIKVGYKGYFDKPAREEEE